MCHTTFYGNLWKFRTTLFWIAVGLRTLSFLVSFPAIAHILVPPTTYNRLPLRLLPNGTLIANLPHPPLLLLLLPPPPPLVRFTYHPRRGRANGSQTVSRKEEKMSCSSTSTRGRNMFTYVWPWMFYDVGGHICSFFSETGKKERRCIIDPGISCVSIWTSPPSRLQTQKKMLHRTKGAFFTDDAMFRLRGSGEKKYASQNVWAKIAMHSLRVQHCDRHAKIDVSGSTM